MERVILLLVHGVSIAILLDACTQVSPTTCAPASAEEVAAAQALVDAAPDELDGKPGEERLRFQSAERCGENIEVSFEWNFPPGVVSTKPPPTYVVNLESGNVEAREPVNPGGGDW